jgi:hypothetical protein
MEDSHVAQTDIDVPAHHFDGPATKNVNVDGKVCTITVFLVLFFCSTSTSDLYVSIYSLDMTTRAACSLRLYFM